MGTFDAIAVGGGLAGAAFALELARNGARVAILERTSGPTLKVCGDFLSREACELLAYLDVNIAELGATKIGTLRLVTGERSAKAELPFMAAGLSRLQLDEALLERAQAAGAEVLRGEAVTALEPQGGSVRVRTGPKDLRGRCAALATGKHNLRRWPRAVGTMTAFKVQVELTSAAARSLDRVVQLASYRGGYIGACNVEGGTATLCWLMDVAALREVGGDWRAHLTCIARRCSAVGDLIAGARFLSARPAAVSAIPYGYKRHVAIAANVYPVGDQLAVIPSFTGDGTSLALSAGVAAARAVLQDKPAKTYQASFLADVRAQFLWAKAVDVTFKSALTRNASVEAIAAMPLLARGVARLTRLQGAAGITGAPIAPATTRAQ
jgi:flavin-dependent dehydrogenase